MNKMKQSTVLSCCFFFPFSHDEKRQITLTSHNQSLVTKPSRNKS